jgi:hypothetical protein
MFSSFLCPSGRFIIYNIGNKDTVFLFKIPINRDSRPKTKNGLSFIDGNEHDTRL